LDTPSQTEKQPPAWQRVLSSKKRKVSELSPPSASTSANRFANLPVDVTEDENITPQQLIGKKMLPSQMIMDNIFFYGECEIIGTIPLEDNEADFPIHYGKGFSKLSPKTIHYQCGKTLVTLEDGIELYSNFRNGCIGFYLNIKLPILKECIKENSNAPFWNLMPLAYTEEDLRNPKFHKELSEIKKQVFG
ncbi:MAG: hypothetical protein IJD37_03570, partial [Clostridia bacterium]|nr:hypothetical protein [Clostridia bacterium]